MTVTADALDMLAGDPPRYPHVPGDFHRHPETGAPYVNHPSETTRDGSPKRVMYGRPSSFGTALDNPFNLLKWKERKLVEGIARQPDAGGIDLLDLDDRGEVDGFIAYAYEVAETLLAADRGTHVHLLCELCDRGRDWTELYEAGEALGIPEVLQQRIVAQWRVFRRRLGLTALAVEQTVVNDRWRLAGTLDRLDVSDRDHLTAYGVLEAGVPFVGDIKTGGLTLGNDGQPNYWVKYPVQLAAYVDAVPYDVETDERAPMVGDDPLALRPHAGIALIYNYDLARALDGEAVDWQAIPVNVQAGREGGDLCRAAADFAKRRDLFAMPAPPAARVLGNANGGNIAAPVPVPTGAVEQTATDPEPDTASPPVPGQAAGIHHSPDPYRAAKREHLRARMQLLILQHPEADLLLRHHWPTDVPTLKHDGHTDEQLARILAAVRRVETEVGASWHPDDGPPPVVRQHLEDEVPFPAAVYEGGRCTDEQIRTVGRSYAGLSTEQWELCKQIAKEAHQAGRSISVTIWPTRRRWSIARAVIAWAASGRSVDELWLQAGLLATHAQCCDADATLGGLISQFTIEQADRLYDAAQNISG